MATTYLHLGTNKGDKQKNLSQAIKAVRALGTVDLISSVYETEPWGNTDQDVFYNIACELRTDLKPMALLDAISKIEDDMGRIRTEKWGSRVIDIDIIAYENQVIDTDRLCIPHKHLHERNFVLVPMMEIAGLWEHPIKKVSVEELFIDCEDPCEVIMTDIQIS